MSDPELELARRGNGEPRATFKSRWHDRAMSGSVPWTPAPPPTYDPNAVLRHIDQTTTQIFHWVRIGVVVLIVLVAISIVI